MLADSGRENETYKLCLENKFFNKKLFIEQYAGLHSEIMKNLISITEVIARSSKFSQKRTTFPFPDNSEVHCQNHMTEKII